MILLRLQNLIRLELKNTYPKLSLILVELLGILFSLSLYYFTSKAFIPKSDSSLNFYGMDYFSFILIGELGLSIPCYLLAQPAFKLSELAADNTLNALISYPQRLWLILVQFTLASSSLELIRLIVNIVLALFIFNLDIAVTKLFSVLVLLLLLSPLFLGLGLLSASFSIYFKKRGGVTAQLLTVSMFLAGAYFPIEVLPEVIKAIGLYLLPFNPVMQLLREIVSGHYSEDITTIISSLCVWSILSPVVGVYMMKSAEKHLQISGDPLLFTR